MRRRVEVLNAIPDETKAVRQSKQWFAWTDSYGVDILEGEDAVLILASTVVIDMACHPDGHR